MANDEHLSDAAPEAARKTEPQAGASPPAISIIIQSWMTPLVAVILLAAGFGAGFFVRPLTGTAAPPAPEGAAAPASAAESAAPTDAPDPTREAQRQALMAAVTQNTRHFRGDPSAPVTMIEFSDFQ